MHTNELPPDMCALLPSQVLAVLNAGVLVLNPHQQIIYWNRWLEVRSQWSADKVLGQSIYTLLPALEHSPLAHAIDEAFQHGRATELPHALTANPFPLYAQSLESTVAPAIEQSLAVTPIVVEGHIRYCLLQISDVTATVNCEALLLEHAVELAEKVQTIRAAESQVRDSEARFRQLAELAPVGIFEVSTDGKLDYMNSRLRELCHLSEHETLDSLVHIVHPDDQESLNQGWNAACAQKHTYETELRFLLRDRLTLWVQILAAPIIRTSSPGATTLGGFVGTVADISERKALEIHHEYLAYHDGLTGLPNRLHLLERLRTTLLQRQMDRGKLAVLYLDLDKFKQVNDVHGHALGDALLIAVAQRMLACVRSSDCVARLGGDEFVIILSNISGAEMAAKVAEKIIENISLPFEFSGLLLRTGTSIGIAMSPDDGLEVSELLAHADNAMYVSKQSARGRYHFYGELDSNLR